MGPKGQPDAYTDSRGGPRGEYMVAVGVTYAMMRGRGWGLAIRAATARKNLSDAAITLGHRAGPNVWYPFPHGVALVFHEKPEWARYAKKYPGVIDPGVSAIKREWPEYFEGTVAAPPPKLRKGDRVRTEEALGKGIGAGEIMEVTRLTPSMIYTDNGFRIPTWMYAEGKVVRVATVSSSRVASRFLQADTEFTSAYDIGDPVWVELQGQRLAGNVRAVTHTNAKVRYAVSCDFHAKEGGATTLHNLDSILVMGRDGRRVEWEEADNYS
jgi:hypothetical protein